MFLGCLHHQLCWEVISHTLQEPIFYHHLKDTYFYSHLVGIDGNCRETVINVRSHKTFMLQPQELLQNLVSAKAVIRLMFCLDSALDGISPRICKMVSLLSSI